ncbi:hypothetical protein E2320_017749 [Naja naja]|nr:hypothetical protein E2320_017749 [Naja naja]
MLSHIAPKDNLNWSLLLLILFLHFCLGQEENMEVSRRDNNPVAKVLESHHQTGHKGSSSREKLRQRSQLYKWTVEAVDECGCRADFGFRGYQGPPGLPGPAGIPGNHGNNGNNGSKVTKEIRGTWDPEVSEALKDIKEKKVAFMASMATHFSNQNSGIIFSSVETNIGNFFDVMTGRFGAPVNGVYFFSFNMMKHEDVEEVYVYLMHNGNTVFSLYSFESKGKSDSSSNSAVLKLAKGDEVWLRMGNGALHGDHQRFSTFAGFLLFETK